MYIMIITTLLCAHFCRCGPSPTSCAPRQLVFLAMAISNPHGPMVQYDGPVEVWSPTCLVVIV